MSLHAFIEPIVKEIVTRTGELPPEPQHEFLNWLGDHAVVMRGATMENLAEKLSAWLDDLAPAGILWEYRLLLTEIEWWAKQEKL